MYRNHGKNVDMIISGGENKGYDSPWYDSNSHVYTFQNYGNGSEFGHFLLKYDKNNNLFLGYKNVINGSISQTLMADDFKIDAKEHKWIKNKLNNSLNVIYKPTIWGSPELT